jgi:hypothetical protein
MKPSDLVMRPSTPDQIEDSAPRAKRSWQVSEVLLIALLFFVATGDPTPAVNETHYIARLKHCWNPQWCAGDLFLESTDTQLVFIWLFGWLTRFVSLPATAWIGRVVAWLFVAWSWQRLSWRIVPRPLAAVLSAGLFMALNAYLQMAGEWVVGGVEAKCFAYGFVLLALAEVVQRRWGLVCALLGAAIAFHPIVGGWSAFVCAIIWLFAGRREQGLMSLLPGIVVGLLLAFVGIAPALSLTWHDSPDVVIEASRIYVFDRLPHHLAILSLPEAEVRTRIANQGALLVMLLAFAWTARRLRSAPDDVAPAAGCRRIAQFAWGGATIAGAGLLIELWLLNDPQAAAKILRYYWFRLTDFSAPMAVALLATSTIVAGLQLRRRWAVPLFIAALCFVGWYLASTSYARVQSPVPPADVKIADYPAWVEVCDWIAANTPPNSLFLTPRLNLSFKWRTGRPEVVNRKDIPQDAHNILDWNRRLKDIYYTKFGGIEQTVDSVGALGDERVYELTKKYHADFVLADRSQLLSLPVAFKNEDYVVYRVPDRRPDTSR